MSLCVWCVEPVLWGEGKLESPKLEFRRRASNLSDLFQRFFLFYFCLFISGPPLFVALFFSFRFCDSPPVRSLIFSGFIARECQASLQLKWLQSHYCRNRSCGRRRKRRRLISRNGAICVMGMAICNLVTEVLKSCNPWINCNWTPVFQRFLQTNPWTLICFAIVPPINPKLCYFFN
jgi:hypothetical protein